MTPKIPLKDLTDSWDIYMGTLATAAASQSKCLSNQIGAIIVRDKYVISTGYNGPPRGVPHCGEERMRSDHILFKRIHNEAIEPVYGDITMCPRYRLGFHTGMGLDMCPSVHAEANAINNAARQGVRTEGSTMYITCGVPCKDCLGAIINAGIVEVVCSSMHKYDRLTDFVMRNTEVEVRVYE